jgi:hypothetical protein
MPATTNTHFQEIGEGWEVNLEIQRETGPEATIDGVDYPAYDESTYAIRVLSSGDDLESLAEAFEEAAEVTRAAFVAQSVATSQEDDEVG